MQSSVSHHDHTNYYKCSVNFRWKITQHCYTIIPSTMRHCSKYMYMYAIYYMYTLPRCIVKLSSNSGCDVSSPISRVGVPIELLYKWKGIHVCKYSGVACYIVITNLLQLGRESFVTWKRRNKKAKLVNAFMLLLTHIIKSWSYPVESCLRVVQSAFPYIPSSECLVAHVLRVAISARETERN